MQFTTLFFHTRPSFKAVRLTGELFFLQNTDRPLIQRSFIDLLRNLSYCSAMFLTGEQDDAGLTPWDNLSYDICGREGITLVNLEHQPGYYKAEFDAQNLPTGVYFYRIGMKDFTNVKKM